MGRLFGTDGIRGKANEPPMTPETAMAVGRAVACVCRRDGKARIVIGRDTRASGDMLESALASGICSAGVDVGLLGVIPTPGVAFAVHHMAAAAGIVISASHNPFDDNGIKVFSASGQKLDDDAEALVESLVAGGTPPGMQGASEGTGRIEACPGILREYGLFCRGTAPSDMAFRSLKVVLDCANGATFQVAPQVLKDLSATVLTLNDRPDGTNINRDCGSQHTGGLAKAVKETGADAGLAFDGDGDRLIAVDGTGRELDGDAILAVCARDLLERNLLKNRTVVVTPMSNLGLRIAFEEVGIRCLDAAVGDRHVLELMQKSGASLGGEQSGHVIFLDHHSTGDGIITAVQLLAAMQRSGRTLAELARVFKPAPQRLVNVDVRHKPALESVPAIRSAIQSAESELGSRGRILVRYSGTQMLCRVMVEAPDADVTERLATRLANAVRTAIG